MSEPTSDGVAAPVQEQPLPVCENCGGDGWYIDHADKCYEDGDCSCSGVQVECDVCA